MRALGHVLAILVGDADIVEADAVGAPGLVQPLVEVDEVDRALAHVAGDVPVVEALGHVDRRPATNAPLPQPRDDLAEGQVEIAADHGVVAADAMPELVGDVAVGLGQSGEVPHVAGRDGAQVQRVLARVEAEGDDAILRAKAPPELHGLVVAAERDVAKAELVRGRDGVRAVHRPHGRRLQQLRELRGHCLHTGPASGLAADVDHDPAPVRDAGKLFDEAVDILLAEAARSVARGDVDACRLGKNVRIKANRHRLGFEQDGLRALELLFHRVDVVDDHAAIAELGLQLRHDVHAMDRHVLKGTLADRHRGVQRDQEDRGNVVQLGIGHAATAELGRSTCRRDATTNPSRGHVIAQGDVAGDVFGHGQHPRHAVARLGRVRERLEVFGDVDQAATIDAGVARNAPAP